MITRLEHPRIVLDAAGTETTAVAIEDGVVLATGERAESLGERVIRPEGAVVMPALHDAHIHMWGLGMRAGSATIRQAKSVDEIYRELREYDPGRAASGWVLARDWNDHAWHPGTSLSRVELDRIFPDHPVVLWRVDSHALWANSLAIERSGITDSWDPGPGGSVGRTVDGELDGLFVDDAMEPILKAIPAPTVDEDQAVFLRTAEMLRGHGICGAQLAWVPLDRVDFLRTLHRSDSLPLRVSIWVDGKDPGIEEFVAQGPDRDSRLTIHTVKFFSDGALGSKGAFMLEPYRGEGPEGNRGLVVTEREVLIDRVRRYTEAGWDIAVHAIGDAAARCTLDAFDAAAPGAICRLEHCQTMHADDIARMSHGDRIASVQPIHMHSDAAWAGSVLSPEQLSRLFNWRDLAAVAPLAAGSDYPIEDPNPWHGLSTFVSRLDTNGEVFRSEQAISRVEAIRAYTSGAARAARWDDIGTLHAGQSAEWIAVDVDPWRAAPDEIWNTTLTDSAFVRTRS